MNQLKILLIMALFHPHKGGSEKYAEELYVKLVEKYKENVQVDVLTYNTNEAPEYEEYRELKIYRIPCYTLIKDRFLLPHLFPLLTILNKLKKNKYNYVTTQIRFFDPTWWSWIYAKHIGAKSFYTGHVATHPTYQTEIVKLVAKIVDLTIAKFSVRQYDLLTVANTAAADFLRDTFHVKKEIHLLHTGVDPDFYKPNQEQIIRTPIKTNWQLSQDKILITYIGRVIWTKGVDILFNVAARLIQEGYDNAYFVIAGPGELEDELREQNTKLNLTNRISLPGSLEYQQARELFGISNIFVNPSHHNEGLPSTLLEAGAAGCTVIATDNASTKDIIINGQTGYLIPQKDEEALYQAIKRALDQPQESKIYATNLHKLMLEEYSWEATATKLYELLTKAS